MTPTNKLRFVERKVPLHPFYQAVDANGNLTTAFTSVRVLQQWWEDETKDGEWRDVPLEEEK